MRFCCALLFVSLAVGANWKDSAFPGWTDDTVQRVLTDSPWTRPHTVRLTWTKEDRPFSYRDVPGADPTRSNAALGPLGGISPGKVEKLPERADILVRWAGSLPVRHATALYKQRSDKLDPSTLNSLIPPPESDYVLELFGVPAQLAHSGTGIIETIAKDSAVLRTRSGRALRANRVEVNLQGLTMTIRIHFPRTNPITMADQEIDCEADLKVFYIREKFKLSAMQYLGHLEL
ncbi:MAG: hypothetical protein ABI693_25120 [Bryobacteraceae bacterium]